MKVAFATLWFNLPDGWQDITDDLPPGSPPSLARPDGMGAIQFTVTRYVSGVRPRFSQGDLQAMLTRQVDVEVSSEWMAGHDIVGGGGMHGEDRLGAWYVSDGANLAFITYVGQGEQEQVLAELADAHSIVRSIAFEST